MTLATSSQISDSNLRQGDIILLRDNSELEASGVGTDNHPTEVVILSQTCDVVQRSKLFCLVAPMIKASPAEASAARSGKSPLLLYLEDPDTRDVRIADIGRAFSLAKDELCLGEVVSRTATSASGHTGRRLAARIGRTFSRFPFPDEVHQVFSRLQARLRDKAGTAGNLGQVLDRVCELRVASDQWESPRRQLRLFIIVPSELLIPDEDADPMWTWGQVHGRRPQDSLADITLDRVCDLLLANIDSSPTSALHLWREFGAKLHSTYIAPHLDNEVASVEVDVMSDLEFSYRDMQNSEALDLETLSDSKR